jgi:CheY-like chemotaxis protein
MNAFFASGDAPAPRPERELRILVLDDSEDDVKLVERALRSGDLPFASRRVETREDFLRGLEEGPDVVLVDYNVPGFDGLMALRAAVEQGVRAPIIIVSGSLSDELAVEFLHEGAADYILKDRCSRLPQAIRQAVERARRERERREAHDRFRQLFEAAPDAMALFERDSGRVVEANGAFERAFGPAEAQSEHAWQEALAAGPGRRTIAIRPPGGAGLEIDCSAAPLALDGRHYLLLALRSAPISGR